MHKSLFALAAVPVALLFACGSDDDTGVGQAEILYDGNCQKADCADLARPDTDCTDTAPLFKCSPDSAGACGITYTCPSKDDPNAAVSFSPCNDAECGPKPTTEEEAGCAAGTELTGATCGKLNNAKECAWHAGCVKPGPPIPVDQSKVGAACGPDVDGGGDCPSGAACVTLPRDTGVKGAHCIENPCAAVTCPKQCAIDESYPGAVVCSDEG